MMSMSYLGWSPKVSCSTEVTLYIPPCGFHWGRWWPSPCTCLPLNIDTFVVIAFNNSLNSSGAGLLLFEINWTWLTSSWIEMILDSNSSSVSLRIVTDFTVNINFEKQAYIADLLLVDWVELPMQIKLDLLKCWFLNLYCLDFKDFLDFDFV